MRALFSGRVLWAARLGTALGCALTMCSLHAETLTDPTRPPSSRTGGQHARSEEHFVANIRTVKTSKAGSIALVNGQIVKVGDVIGEARVTRITESEIVLVRSSGATERVRMHPGVDWQPAVRPALDATRAAESPRLSSNK
jgi:MSHA biogenesis protein MshK